MLSISATSVVLSLLALSIALIAGQPPTFSYSFAPLQTPPPAGPPVPPGQVVGFWWWTYSTAATSSPSGTTLSIAFSGYVDPVEALASSLPYQSKLVGKKFISLGGGNQEGRWSKDVIKNISGAVSAGSFAGYDGITFDIEEGDSGLYRHLSRLFALAKANNFLVLVSVSHSAPVGILDAANLIQRIIADPNVDYLSPQLYSTGDDVTNDYSETAGVQWSQYATSKAAIVPSIVNANLFEDAEAHFQSIGVHISGYIQWSQT
jgi:hypothetical protein